MRMKAEAEDLQQIPWGKDGFSSAQRLQSMDGWFWGRCAPAKHPLLGSLLRQQA